MKPALIDLFVDRLCGLFPRDNIARNTVKNAWSRDEFLLLNVFEDEVKGALHVIENDKMFPSLARVKEVFRRLKKTVEYEGPVCEVCNNTGWDDGSRWEETDDGKFIMTHEFFTHIDPLGYPSTYVKKCSCTLVS